MFSPCHACAMRRLPPPPPAPRHAGPGCVTDAFTGHRDDSLMPGPLRHWFGHVLCGGFGAVVVVPLRSCSPHSVHSPVVQGRVLQGVVNNERLRRYLTWAPKPGLHHSTLSTQPLHQPPCQLPPKCLRCCPPPPCTNTPTPPPPFLCKVEVESL